MNDEHNRDVNLQYIRSMDRREFLRLTAGGALAASGVFGCGGGDGGNGSGPGTISENTRNASLDAIATFLDGIRTRPLPEQIAAATTFITPRPEFIATGANEDGVWAIYPDGVPLMILCNRAPDPVPRSISRSTRTATEVPTPLRARLINAMGNAFADDTAIVEPYLSGNGYSVVHDPGTVETLRTVSADGVFYMSTHGGSISVPVFSPDGNFVRDATGKIVVRPEFGIWTASLASPANVAPYLTDLRAGRLGIGFALHSTASNGSPIYERHFWITAAWVQANMSFGVNSLVWFSSCLGNSSKSQNFVQACIAKGAGLYVGWTRPVTDQDCIGAGRFIVDRLVGEDSTTHQESPPQRPFDYTQVWQDMAARGLFSDIRYTVGGNFGLLAPTISYVLIDEFDNEAVLYGTFGTPAANERSVLIGGIEATVKSWQNGQIVCNLPNTGPGSAGDVVVFVRAHKSNVRRITEWNIPMQFGWVDTNRQPLVVKGPINLRFRADVGDYRDFSGISPVKPLRNAIATRDSKATFTASGSFTEGDCVSTWSGSGDFVSGGYGAANRVVAARFNVDTAAGTGAIGLGYGDPVQTFEETIVCSDGPHALPVAPAFGLLDGIQNFGTPDPQMPSIPLSALNITFGADYTIPGRAFVDHTLDPLQIQVTWSDVTPQFPPDPSAARSAKMRNSTGSRKPSNKPKR